MQQNDPKKQNLALLLFITTVILFLSSVFRYSAVYFRNSDTTVYISPPMTSSETILQETPMINPLKTEHEQTPIPSPELTHPITVKQSSGFTPAESSTEKRQEQIDINTADIDELCTLPGIGEKRAEDIIRYRTTQGLFTEPEDIMNVKGIGNKTFEKIKDQITVK
jgi:competence protein ComEA